MLCLLCKIILKVRYLIIILWISLKKGECFDLNHSLGCVFPTLYMIRLLGRVQLADLLSLFIHLQHNVLSCRIDAYFPKHKLAIEIDELGHGDRDIDKEVRRQKAIEKELDCEFIKINPAKEKFDVFAEISKI